MSDPAYGPSRTEITFGPRAGARTVAPAPMSAATQAALVIMPNRRQMADDAQSLGLDPNDVVRNVGGYARNFIDQDRRRRAETDENLLQSAAHVAKGFTSAPQFVRDRLHDGVILSRIFTRWNDAVMGRVSVEDAQQFDAEQRQGLSGAAEQHDYGFLMDTVGTAAEITGQMYAGLRRGAQYAPAAAAVAGAAGMAFGGVGAGPGAALGLPVGFAAGAAHQAQIEATGALYADLMSQPFQLYPDLDRPGQYVTPDQYRRLRRRDPRYTEGAGYTPEEVPMSPGLAKAVAVAAGGATGLMEVAQVKLAARLFGKSKALQRASSRVVERLIRSGKLLPFTAHQMGRIVATGAKETGLEAAQEAVSYLGSYMAIEVDAAARDLGVPEGHRRELIGGLWETMQETALQVGPAMMLLSAVPGTAGGVAQYMSGRQRSKARTDLTYGISNTDAYFDQQQDGENIGIGEVVVDEDAAGVLIDRQRVIVKAILENTAQSATKLPPVTVTTQNGVRTVHSPVDAAIVTALRDAGYQSLRVAELATPEEQQAGAQDAAAAATGTAEVAAGEAQPTIPVSVDSVEGQVRLAFPQESDESIQAMVMHLDLMADAQGLTTEQLLARRYAAGRPAGRVGELIAMAPPPDPQGDGVPFIGGTFDLPPTRQQYLRDTGSDRMPPRRAPREAPAVSWWKNQMRPHDQFATQPVVDLDREPPAMPDDPTEPAPVEPPPEARPFVPEQGTGEPPTTETAPVPVEETATEMPPPEARPFVPEDRPVEGTGPEHPPPSQPDPDTDDIPPAERRRSGELITVNPSVLRVDASRFQFKGEVDEAAIEQRWQGVEEWDPLGSGVIVVWQDLQGAMWVVDGHQRMGLAKKLQGEGKVVPDVPARLYREQDGVTADEARVLGARKNIMEGSGTAIDAARVLRTQPPDILRNLGVSNTIISQARGLHALSDEAFDLVAGSDQISEHMAAVVGRVAGDDPGAQMGILREFIREQPPNVQQAEYLAHDWLRNRGEDVTTQTLFGEEQEATSVWRERAKVLDRALKDLGSRKNLFATVQREAETLQQAGNVLEGQANIQQMQGADLARQAIRTWATSEGPISTALSEAAAQVQQGLSPRAAAREFLNAVELAIAEGQIENIEYLQPIEPEQEPDPTPSMFQTDEQGKVKGWTQFNEAGQAIIKATQAGDFSTWVHEHAHVMRRYLTAEQEAVAGAWAGARQLEDGTWEWNNPAEEKFAEGFEDYLWEGNAPSNALREVWRMFSRLLRNIYAKTRHVLNDDIRGVYEELLVRQDAPNVHAYEQNLISVGDGHYGVFQSPSSEVLLRMKSNVDQQAKLQQAAGDTPGAEPVTVEAWRGDEMLAERHYANREDGLRDISGVPTVSSPVTLGNSTYRMRPGDAPQEVFEVREIADRVYIGGRAESFKEVKRRVIEQLDAAGKLGPGLGSMRRNNYLTELIAGGVEGDLFQVMLRDVDAGRQRELGYRQDVWSRLGQLARTAGIERSKLRRMQRIMQRKVQVPGWDNARKPDWTVGELLSILRHSRIPDNRRALRWRGFRVMNKKGEPSGVIRISEPEMTALLAAASAIDPDIRKLATDLTDLLMDEQWARLDQVHRLAKGEGLGYVASYWPKQSTPEDRKPAGPAEEPRGLDYWRGADSTRIAVFTGMTEQRTEEPVPLILEPFDTVLLKSVDHAAMYLGHELSLDAARQLLMDPQVHAAIVRRAGNAGYSQLKDAMESVARRWYDEPGWERALSNLRRKVTIATLGGNPGVMVKQSLSLELYKTYIPSRYVAAATMQMAIPTEAKRIGEQHRAFDPEYVARGRGNDPDLQSAITGSAAAEAWGRMRFSDRLMSGIRFFDYVAVTTGTQAGVLQVLDEFERGQISEEVRRATGVTAEMLPDLSQEQRMRHAYDYARWVTVRTQPNFLPEHTSAFQRHRVGRYFAMYSGYTNMALNLVARTRWRARQAGLSNAAAQRAMLRAWWGVFVWNVAGAMMLDYLRDSLLGRAPDEDELPSYVGRKVVSGATGLVYFLRDSTYAVLRPGMPGDVHVPLTDAATSMVRGIRAVSDDLIEGEISENTMRVLLQATGLATGVPLGEAYRWAEAMVFDPTLD